MKKLPSIAKIGRFFGAGEILIGTNAFKGIAATQAARVCIVLSASVLKHHEAYIRTVFRRSLVSFLVSPSGEPTLSKALTFVGEVDRFRPDLFVAIGGGSVIDLAKLLWVIYEQPDIELIDNLNNRVSVTNLRSKANFVACPSTFGSGSENSSAAVFQAREGTEKRFLVGSDLLPDIGVLDPVFCQGLPFETAGAGILDAITHAVEGVVSPTSNALTYSLSVSVVSTLRNITSSHPHSIDAWLDPNVATELLSAASLAGIVQNIAIPGLAHSLSHALAVHDVRHGVGCGYFLPLAIKHNCLDKRVAQKYETFSQACGFSDLSALLKWLKDWNRAVVSQPNLKDLALNVVNGDDFDKMVKDPTFASNPITIERERLIAFLSEHNDC